MSLVISTNLSTSGSAGHDVVAEFQVGSCVPGYILAKKAVIAQTKGSEIITAVAIALPLKNSLKNPACALPNLLFRSR